MQLRKAAKIQRSTTETPLSVFALPTTLRLGRDSLPDRGGLEQFWWDGISGADFFVSAKGPAVEVFGLAQAPSEILPEGDKERQLLQELLSGRSLYSTPTG